MKSIIISCSLVTLVSACSSTLEVCDYDLPPEKYEEYQECRDDTPRKFRDINQGGDSNGYTNQDTGSDSTGGDDSDSGGGSDVGGDDPSTDDPVGGNPGNHRDVGGSGESPNGSDFGSGDKGRGR